MLQLWEIVPLSGRLLGRKRQKEGKGPKGRQTDKGKAKDAAAVAKAKEDEEDEDTVWFAMTTFNSERDDESGCESEGESDDGSEEEKVPMSQLMDPSEPEESEANKYQPTSIFTPGDNAFTTTFGSATPRSILSDLGAVAPYLRPRYLQRTCQHEWPGQDRA